METLQQPPDATQPRPGPRATVEDLRLDGHLTLSPADLVRMLLTLRGEDGAWALARFVAFFTRTAAGALLGRRRGRPV